MMKNNVILLALLIASLSVAAPANDAALSKALDANLKGLVLLEKIQKKSEDTPREHDVLVRLIESLIQIDLQIKQKKLSKSKDQVVEKNADIQKKLELYTTRFITNYPKDAMIGRVYSIRARTREDQGNAAGQIQDLETVYQRANQKSEEWLKATTKLGELYRGKGELNKSEKYLMEALKGSNGEWSVFVLESLLMTQGQMQAHERALNTLNQILAKQPKDVQKDSFITTKGQLLGKLLVANKISTDRFYSEISKDAMMDQVTVIKTALLEITVANQESLAVDLIQHSTFRNYQTEHKILVTSELASFLYEQRGYESLLIVLTEMQGYSKIVSDLSTAQNSKFAPMVEAALKRLTELSQKIQGHISKDSKLAKQSEGKALELLYAIISKINIKGDSINAEAKYNKASLYLVQNRPEEAYPLFKELGQFKDSEDKFNLAFLQTLKKSKVIPEVWEYQKQIGSNDPRVKPSVIQDLDSVNKKYCSEDKFEENFCFDSLKGLYVLGKKEPLEPTLKRIVFDSKAKDEAKEQAFTALFDYYQSQHQSEQAAQVLNQAQKKGIRLSRAVSNDAQKSVRSQSLYTVKKYFDEGKNEALLQYVKKYETDNDQQLYAEMFAFAGIAAQRLNQDAQAQAYYEKFDEQALKDPKLDSSFYDMVAVGHAISYEHAHDFTKSAFWWTKVKNWKDSGQKRIALNAMWLAADITKFKTMMLTPKFCDKQDEALCVEYQKLFVATWPVYIKDFHFRKAVPVQSASHDPLDLMMLLTTQENHPSRLAWVTELHSRWSSMEPIRQIALYPNFQKFLKAEIEDWSKRESAQFAKVRTLMDFQKALKDFKSNEGVLQPFSRSHWSDVQVYTDIAVALVYRASNEALNKAKAADQAILVQDPSIKELFEKTSQQLAAKEKELMERGVSRTQNYSMDLTLFDGLTQKYPEWAAVSKQPVKTSPASFFANLSGNAKVLRDHWLAAFKTYNWPKVAYCITQISGDKSISQDVAQTFEAETFLRFGNRIDSQQTIVTLQNKVGVGPAPASTKPQAQGKAK